MNDHRRRRMGSDANDRADAIASRYHRDQQRLKEQEQAPRPEPSPWDGLKATEALTEGRPYDEKFMRQLLLETEGNRELLAALILTGCPDEDMAIRVRKLI